jgi:hypothetical protein
MKLHDYFKGTWTGTRITNESVSSHFVTAGCSHTGAVGLDSSQGYTAVLSRDLNLLGVNLSLPGGNHQVLAYNVTRWLRHHRPEFVIAQGPHPMRKLIWRNGSASILNVHADKDPLFDNMLRYGDENFYCEWLQSILTISVLCNTAGIPCVHWALDELEQPIQHILNDNDLVLHSNDVSSTIWNRDNAARDRRHHSEKCHAQWAQKLKGLLNEHTTR